MKTSVKEKIKFIASLLNYNPYESPGWADFYEVVLGKASAPHRTTKGMEAFGLVSPHGEGCSCGAITADRLEFDNGEVIEGNPAALLAYLYQYFKCDREMLLALAELQVKSL